MSTTDNTIQFCIGADSILVLDKNGMTYKGQRIEDAGEAHRALLEVLALMKLDATKP